MHPEADSIIYVDPFGGVAGDMFCAALVALGTPLATIEEGLRALPLTGWSVKTEAVRRGPFAATRFAVDEGHAHHHHRTWGDIREMIGGAVLPERVKARATAVFRALAEAEGRVHGVPPDRVHFHEVGATDAIVDVVGACIGLEHLGVGRIVAGALPLGGGRIETAHGPIPLPAPATVELLRGWPVRPGRAGMEQVTPTGAAIVAALGEPGPIPEMVLQGVGIGAGTLDPPDLPNVVRLLLGREGRATHLQVEVVSAQMDDLPGEHLPTLLEALAAAGAVDAFAVPVLMKKGRPGLLVEALAPPDAAPAVEEAMLRHGSTFGVRRAGAVRRILDRRHEQVHTPWGPVRVKVGALGGEVLHAAPEFEDVAAVARAAGVPSHRVHSEAVRAWNPPPPGGREDEP